MFLGNRHSLHSTALDTEPAAPSFRDESSRSIAADTESTRALSHLPRLDGLRAYAVIGVLAFHVTVMAEFPAGSAVEQALHALAEMGRNGVDLFFVLSGFLITAILLSTRDRPGYFRSFYARRALRILPAYYLCLAIIAAVCTFEPTLRRAMARTWPWYVTYLTNFKFAFYEDDAVELTRHLWSLAIEEQFYMLWPVFVALLPRRTLLPLTCISIGLIALGRSWWAQQEPSGTAVYMATWTRADALLVGAVLAIARTHASTWSALIRGTPFALTSSVGCLCVPFVRDWLDLHAATFSLFAIQSAALIVLCVAADERGIRSRLLSHPILQRIGQLSYGLYLVHFPLSLYLAPWGSQLPVPGSMRWPLTLALVAIVSFLLAALSFRFVEAPVLGLKRYVPRPGEPRTVA